MGCSLLTGCLYWVQRSQSSGLYIPEEWSLQQHCCQETKILHCTGFLRDQAECLKHQCVNFKRNTHTHTHAHAHTSPLIRFQAGKQKFPRNSNYELLLTFSFSYYVVVFISGFWDVIEKWVPTTLHARKETELSIQWKNWKRMKYVGIAITYSVCLKKYKIAIVYCWQTTTFKI